MNQALIRRAHQGEISYVFAELTHVVKDLSTGESFGISEKLMDQFGLCEGDIVEYEKTNFRDGNFALNITQTLYCIFEN